MRFGKIWIPFVFFFTTIILTGCCTQTTVHPSVPQIAQTANSSTVALIADFNKMPFCTGVWVSDSTILTANHCVEGYAEMLHRVAVMKALEADGMPDFMAKLFANMDLETLRAGAAGAGSDDDDDDGIDVAPLFQHVLEIVMSVPPVSPDGLTIPFTTPDKVVDNGVAPRALFHSVEYARDHKEDLAVLHIDRTESVSKHSVAVLADEEPAVGEHIYGVGQTLGGFFSFKDGLVSAYKHDLSHFGMKRISGPFMQTTVQMAPGDSGGGAFDSDGHLVGLASFIMEEAHFGFYIPLDTIRGFLQGQRLVPVHLDPMAPDPDLSK